MPPQNVPDEPVKQLRVTWRERLNVLAQRLRTLATWVAGHRFWAAAIGVAGLLLVGAAVATWVLLRPARYEAAPVSVEELLAALDSGAFRKAKQLAERAAAEADTSVVPPAVVNLVLGIAAAADAAKASLPAQKALYLVSARYLEEALAQGLPEDRRAEAQLLLGKSLYEAGQMPASRSVLNEAIKVHPGRAAEIRLLLAAAYLRDPVPRLADALAQNQLYLADDKLSADQRHQGLVQQAEILLNMGKAADCLAVLEKIPRAAKQRGAAAVLRGRAMLEEARAIKAKASSPELQRQAAEKLRSAASALREILDDDALTSEAGRQAMYLVGVCLSESGDARGALSQFHRLRDADPGTPEYLAAAFQEALLLRTMGRDREAAPAYGRALKAVGDAAHYRNPWVSLEQLRHRVGEAHQHYLETRDYGLGLELARSAAGIFSPERAVQMEAETYRAWGRDLIARSEEAPPGKAATLAREGRLQLRRASRIYRRLAKLRVLTRSYTDDLWESAVCALEGQDYRGAARLLEEYLAQQPRARQAQALAGLGEAYLSLDRIDKSIAALEQCIVRYPRDVAAIRARLLASQAYLEQGDTTSAERLLEENLNGELLTPASKEYRDSLLALGKLLVRGQRYDEAVRRFEEVVSRYSPSRHGIEARYWIADCRRRQAISEAGKLAQDMVEQSRVARRRRMQEGFAAALEGYRQTQQALLNLQENTELHPVEKLMLRNCCFFIGSMLVELGQYEAAVKACAMATSRYPNLPETLEAHVEMARALRAMNKPSEARGAIEQARLLLARMPAETPFHQTSNYTRSQWSELLRQMSETIKDEG